MQIGCDPKADSTIALRHGEAVPTVLDLFREKKQDLRLEDMVRTGYQGVICVEAGGPTPGLGCAGRGIITALEKLKETGAYEVYRPDVVLYDVLGDVVCGGFSMPMRKGYADKGFIITSGENMAIHAGANIAMAVENFKTRGYASLGGIILNRRNVAREEEKVKELAAGYNEIRQSMEDNRSRRNEMRDTVAALQQKFHLGGVLVLGAAGAGDHAGRERNGAVVRPVQPANAGVGVADVNC